MSQNRRRNNDIVISIYTQAYNFTTSLRNKEINIKISENVESVHIYIYKYMKANTNYYLEGIINNMPSKPQG